MTKTKKWRTRRRKKKMSWSRLTEMRRQGGCIAIQELVGIWARLMRKIMEKLMRWWTRISTEIIEL